MIRPVALLAAVALLSACQQPAQEKAAETAPAPAPAATSAAIDPTVLTGKGIGPVRIGMTAADLTAAWGPDSEPGAVGGAEPGMCDQYHPSGAPAGVNVMVQQGVLTRITLMRDATVKTDKGFGLGDAAAAIKAAYGGAIVAQPHKYEPAPAEDLIAWSRDGSTTYVTNPAARGVRYEIDTSGKVKMIHAGDPSIQLVEGCS